MERYGAVHALMQGRQISKGKSLAQVRRYIMSLENALAASRDMMKMLQARLEEKAASNERLITMVQDLHRELNETIWR